MSPLVNRLNSQADSGDKTNGSNASIASSCFDRVVELQNQGFDESDIRAVTGTAYLGEIPSMFELSHPL